jgi:hypothetical protein
VKDFGSVERVPVAGAECHLSGHHDLIVLKGFDLFIESKVVKRNKQP